MQYIDPQKIPAAAAATENPKRKLGRPALFLLSAGVAFAVLALGALGVFLYFGGEYSRAEDRVAAKDFVGAQQCLLKVPAFYKDSPQLMDYAQAGAALADKKFDRAKAYYVSLGDYRDARALQSEADYRKAGALLDASDFNGAKALYAALAQKNYKDSAAMVSEADYRAATAFYAKNDYKNALDAYSALGNYKDSKERLSGITNELFSNAVSDYRKGSYEAARSGFLLVAGYNEDAKKYIYLIDAHSVTVGESRYDYVHIKEIYDNLLLVGNMEDAMALKMSDVFMPYFLEGTWLYSDGSPCLSVTHPAAATGWMVDGYHLDRSYKFENGNLYRITNDSTWVVDVTFLYVDDNTCEATLYGPTQTYIIHRQK